MATAAAKLIAARLGPLTTVQKPAPRAGATKAKRHG